MVAEEVTGGVNTGGVKVEERDAGKEKRGAATMLRVVGDDQSGDYGVHRQRRRIWVRVGVGAEARTRPRNDGGEG